MRNIIKVIKDWLRVKLNKYKAQALDKRDYVYQAKASELKDSVDFRQYFTNIRNQGWTNACTGFAVAALTDFKMNYIRQLNGEYTSPMFNWYYGRMLHGEEELNSGVWLRYSLKALLDNGFVVESLMPFDGNYKKEPDIEAISHAEISKMYLQKTSYFLMEPEDVTQALSDGTPVVFGLRLNSSFYGNTDGMIKDSSPDNNYHAMLAVGYTASHIIVRNSWGAGWGDKGYCYIPHNYFKEYAHDCWTIDENDN